MKVKLNDDYNGYFKDFKNRELTVIEIIKDREKTGYCDKSRNPIFENVTFYKIREFMEVDKYHLCKDDSFKKLN